MTTKEDEIKNIAKKESKKFLGRGVYIFEETMKPTPDRGMVVDVDTMDDDEFNDPTAGETGLHEITANSFAEYTHKFAVDAGLKGSYMGFSGALKTKYSNKVTNSTTTKFMKISNTITCHFVSIGTDPDVYQDWLTEGFKKALLHKTPEELFNDYGTHVAMSVKMGGSAYYTCNSVETKSLSERDFKISAEAKFKSKGGNVSGSTELTDDEKQKLNNVDGDVALDVCGGGAAEAQELRNNKTDAWAKWAASVEASPAFMGFPEVGLIPIWKFVKDPNKQKQLETAYNILAAKFFPVEIFWKTSEAPSARPDESVVIPEGYKLLSGGAYIPEQTTNGHGLLLTASFPENDNKWRVMGKDHVADNNDTSTITAYAMALYDPDDIWEVSIFSDTSKDMASAPMLQTWIKDKSYHLVGGGVRVDWTGAGNLLTGTFPQYPANSAEIWFGSSKDHWETGLAKITVYAIGLRSKLKGVSLEVKNTCSDSETQAHPSAEASPPQGYKMVGGGARVANLSGSNFLIASYPVDSYTWKAKSKDHVYSDPQSIQANALGVKVIVS